MSSSLNAVATNFGLVCKHALRAVSREHVVALADQAVVSGTSLLTTLLIARWSNPSQLGIYAVGTSLLMSVVAFQDSLILEPYIIQRHYTEGTAAERAGASLTLSVLFSALSIVALTALAFGFREWNADPVMVATSWAIASIVPFALTRNFARRFSFARLEFGGALLLDLAVAAAQFATLGWLGSSGRMSALSAWVAFGAANALAAIGWLYSARAKFVVTLRHLRTVSRQTWPLGKWLVVGQITVLVQGNITYWLSIVIAGAAVTGLFAACMSIVGVANPLLLGLGNSIMPRAVLAWKDGGGQQLWREAIRNTMLIAALMTGFTLAILIAGDQAMHLLFHGAEYEGHRQTLTVLSLSVLAGALGAPAQFALASMERPRTIVVCATLGATVTVVLVWALMTRWGLLGAAYGLLGGSAAGSIARWVAFQRIVMADRSTWLSPMARRAASTRDV